MFSVLQCSQVCGGAYVPVGEGSMVMCWGVPVGM